MSKYNKFLIVSNSAKPTNIALLANSIDIETESKSRSELFHMDVDADAMVAYSMAGKQLTHNHTASEINLIAQRFPIFVFDVARGSCDPQQALDLGVRGIIYSDDQLDKLLTAFKVLSEGQLYYPRWLLSELVNEMLTRRIEQTNNSDSAFPHTSLTKQELNIVKLVAQGARNKEVAYQLNISAHTVKTHLSSIFRKTQARNRVELLRWSQQSNIVNYHPDFSIKSEA
ncbi:response regulator transcription factor [Aliidiomarina soli]|uniref:DNA-binding response regulator n=1 Tax=Aliidiomarina soli TaxID=1928574 RepID=A0A432WIP4_9GAMM|nr:response regulator transcription factor [Aliidiomarina soli]RUO33615.1 DNA-binding response regulator [Aliidiomarina soli]